MKHSTTGGDHRSRQMLKQGKASRTPGKTKGHACTTDARKKFFLTHPHAHRLDPDGYSKWHAKAKEMNK